MDTHQTPTYGTVASAPELAPVKQSRRGAVVAVALLLVGAAAVLGAGHLSSQHAAAAVHPNKMKAQHSPMIGVEEKAMQLLNQTTYGLRWVIIRFNPKKTAMMPVMQGVASDDWELDWKSFTNAVTFEDGTDAAPAVGLYNFAYWADDDTQATQPLVVTYSPEEANSKEIARFGYFLGSLLLATDADNKMSAFDYVALDDVTMDYKTFCAEALTIEGSKCSMDDQFHNCPWDESAEGSPCGHKECEGASFENPDEAEEGTVPISCCNYVMDDFCKRGENVGHHGCHAALLKTLGKLCDEPRPDETPELLVTPGMVQKCEADCVQPCMFFKDDTQTWKQCSGCPVDGLEDKDGKIYQCHSKALGFQFNRCCGIDASCRSKDSGNAEMCDALEYYQCSWEFHTDCGDIEAEQTRLKEIQDAKVASGTGCCESRAKDSEDEYTMVVDVYGTDCGGEHTDEAVTEKTEFRFNKDKSCEVVKEEQAAAAKAKEEEAAAAAAAAADAAAEEEAIEERRRR